MTDAPAESPLDAAARRLSAALERLDQKLQARSAAPAAPGGGGEELAALSAALEQEKARVRELEAAAADASAALGRTAGVPLIGDGVDRLGDRSVALLGRAAAEIRATVGEPVVDLFPESL